MEPGDAAEWLLHAESHLTYAKLGQYFRALMLGVYDKGRLQYVGHTGTGFSEALLKDLLGILTPYFIDSCPFTPKPKANER